LPGCKCATSTGSVDEMHPLHNSFIDSWFSGFLVPRLAPKLDSFCPQHGQADSQPDMQSTAHCVRVKVAWCAVVARKPV
jgi:hypothetical protein